MSEFTRQTKRWFDVLAAIPIPGPSDCTRTGVSNWISGPTAGGDASALARGAAASPARSGSRAGTHASRFSPKTTTAIWPRILTLHHLAAAILARRTPSAEEPYGDGITRV